MSSITINKNSTVTRKDGLRLLGSGCINCEYRNKCFIDRCNITISHKYDNMTDLGSSYLTYAEDFKFETYVRKYKHGYIMIVKGEKYKSGEVNMDWHIDFYDKDMKSKGMGISAIKDIDIIEKNGKRYMYIYNLKFHYGINDLIPLQNSNVIIM